MLSAKSALKTKLLVALVITYVILADIDVTSARRRNRNSRRHFRQMEGRNARRSSSSSTKIIQSLPVERYSRNRKFHTEHINTPEVAMGDLLRLVYPRSKLQEDSKLWIGTVRHQRLYCPIGVGYHLEIKRNGSVRAREASRKATEDTVLKIFSLEIGEVGIRSVPHKRYLCMRKSGKLYTSRRFRNECRFLYNLEENKYNTYASALYSRRRKGYFLALRRNGKPRRGKKVSWRHRAAHWLPREVGNS